MRKIQISYTFRSVYQIDMKFYSQLRPATETSRVVSYGGKTIPRWRTSAILKIDISPYLSEKSSDFHEILYIAADIELGERHVIKNENFQNSSWRTVQAGGRPSFLRSLFDRLRVRQNVFLVTPIPHYALHYIHSSVSPFVPSGFTYN